jgi:hypothetical protein
MNKYFKFTVESDLGTGTQYIEFNENNWAIRQAECHEGRWFNSFKEKYHPELGGIALFDQQLTELGMQRGEPIDAREFESAWKLSNREVMASHFKVDNKSEIKENILLLSPVNVIKENAIWNHDNEISNKRLLIAKFLIGATCLAMFLEFNIDKLLPSLIDMMSAIFRSIQR